MSYKRTKSLHESRKFGGGSAIKDPTYCPNCGTDASGYSEIKEKFGLRTMTDGVKRVQSWCKDCRRYRFGNRFN